MELKALGWELYQKYLKKIGQVPEENVARVAVENRGSYLLYSQLGELEGIMRGKFMNSGKTDSEYPKVGDWVVFEKLAGEQKAIIKSILPRKSKISRMKAGDDLEEQIIATNIEIVFIVQGLDGDFNLNRLERYVAMAKEGKCEPVVLLNKCDIVQDGDKKLAQAKKTLPGVKIFLTSAISGVGIEEARLVITAGNSLVFVGSSGAGKSSLINQLLGDDRQKIGEIREDDSKGKHTTTKRELILLDSGGVLIDTPGMRELGMWGQAEAVIEVFDDIKALIENCKFNDCDHEFSKGCAIIEAVNRGEIAQDRYQRFLKIKNELDPLKTRNKRNSESSQRRSLRRVVKRPEFNKNK